MDLGAVLYQSKTKTIRAPWVPVVCTLLRVLCSIWGIFLFAPTLPPPYSQSNMTRPDE